MKKIISIIALSLALTFILSLAFTNVAHAEPITSAGKVTVTGYGEVTLAPDTATISVGVKTTDETLEKANAQNKEKISKLYETLKANNIEDKNIQTKNFYAHEEYSYKENEPKLTGYTVSNQVFIKTTNLENLTVLVSDLMADGANNFNGVNFSSGKESESYKTALADALANAREKAKILTNSENITIVEIIEESVSSFRNFVSYQKTEMVSDNSFFGGELCVKARVTVVFSTQINGQTTTENKETAEMKQENKKVEKEQNASEKIDVSEPEQNQILQDNLNNENNINNTNNITKTANGERTPNTAQRIQTTEEKPITLPRTPERKRPIKPASPQII